MGAFALVLLTIGLELTRESMLLAVIVDRYPMAGLSGGDSLDW